MEANVEEQSNTPLISVIVPIYNVEKYVRKCLDSLRSQTMKQIEIICIDDGSTDGSGRIADEYKNEEGWPIFRIIHTENRGLSAARNLGIDEARAEWLMFVDSDDWVESEFCEIPYKASQEYGADLVIFDYDWWKNENKLKIKEDNKPIGKIDEFIVHKYGGDAAWNKMYKKDLFSRIRYPEGRVYEDTATTHKIVHCASEMVWVHEYLYHHVIRKNSILHTHSLKNKKDCLLANKEKSDNLVKYGVSEEFARLPLCGAAIGFLSVADCNDDELFLFAEEILNSTCRIPKMMTKKQKIAFLAWKINKRLFTLLGWLDGRYKQV